MQEQEKALKKQWRVGRNSKEGIKWLKKLKEVEEKKKEKM